MESDELREISEKLDVLTRLTALLLTEEKKQADQFLLLNRAGFKPKDIAELLGTTPNTVRVALSTLRKKKKLRR